MEDERLLALLGPNLGEEFKGFERIASTYHPSTLLRVAIEIQRDLDLASGAVRNYQEVLTVIENRCQS